MTSVGVISVGLSNLGSLLGALERISASHQMIDDPKDLNTVDRVIIPGVGSFSHAMKNLGTRGLVDPLRDFFNRGKPMMGICLGMQLLGEKGLEGAEGPGLGLVTGSSSKLPEDGTHRIPHMGWNSIEILHPHPVLEGVPSESDFYFVHSYAIAGFEAPQALAKTNHGVDFLSGVFKANVVGFQFHPEKSQRNGSKIIKNFVGWDGSC